MNSSTKEEIKREQVRLLYASLSSGQLAVLINGSIIIAILWEQIAHQVLILWLGTLISIIILRLVDWLQFLRIADQPFSASTWEKRFLAGLLVAGITWGASAVFLFSAESTSHQLFLAIILVAITAGSLSTLSSNFLALLLFYLLILPALALRLLLTGSTIGQTMGGLVILYTLILVVNGRRFCLSILENIQLRIEAQLNAKKLNESEKRYHALFDKSRDPIWVISGNKFTVANQAAVKVLGFNSKEELVNTHPSKVSPPFQYDGSASAEKAEKMMRLAYDKGFNRFEWAHQKRDGTVLPVDVSLTRIEIEGNEQILCIWRDISAQKEVENALQVAKEQAETASRSKDEFLANMSHEIRTPMNAIVGFTDMALATHLSEEQHEYILAVKHGCDSLLFLINDILDFSKIEAGKLEIDHLDFNLREVIGRMVIINQGRIKEKNLEFTQVTPPLKRLLRGDPARLQQILTNLIGNAIKFTATGQICLEITVKEENRETIILDFAVTDTGIGIAREKQASIFEEFSQADGSVTRNFGGTGLGLTISNQLVSLLGGKTLQVKSREGEGSTFSFQLPFSLGGVIDMEAGNMAEPERQLEKISACRVLLVEDNPVNIKLASSLLEKQGHRVSVAENGLLGVEAAGSGDFDLILMDIMMPEMDGLTATREIRRLEAENATDKSHVPIIAMTANAMKGDRERCLAAGMDDYLSKPIKIAKINEVMGRCLAGQKNKTKNL